MQPERAALGIFGHAERNNTATLTIVRLVLVYNHARSRPWLHSAKCGLFSGRMIRRRAQFKRLVTFMKKRFATIPMKTTPPLNFTPPPLISGGAGADVAGEWS